MKFTPALFLILATQAAQACELCAIYSAGNALGESGNGVSFALAEQFIPYPTPKLDGKEVQGPNPSYVDSSITHLVPGYNFSPRFGVNLNLPLTYLNFQRRDVRYSLVAPPVFFTEKGT